MNSVWFAISCAAVGWIFAAPLSGGSQTQSQPEPQEVHEVMEISLVDVYLTAVNSKGAFVTDLTPADLVLTEDGVPQVITNFSLSTEIEEELVNAIIMIDTSVSMNEEYKHRSKMSMAKEAALLLLKQLKEQDNTMLVTFSNTPAEATLLTTDKAVVVTAINALKTDYGRTALLDAVFYVAEKTEERWGRRLVFICSDGQDNASTRKLQKVIDRIKESPDLMIVTLGTTQFESRYEWMGEKEEQKQGEATLQSLADASGGYAFFPSNFKDLDSVMQRLQRVVGSQYSLAYSSSNPKRDGAWRKIEITTTRKNVKLRYRTGYFAK